MDILINPEATEQQRLEIMGRMGLDRPLWEQFLGLFSAPPSLPLPHSLPPPAAGRFSGAPSSTEESAMSVILQRLPATMELALFALVLAIVLGVPLGVIAGLRPDTVTGRGIMAGSILGFSLPNFWQGLMLILIFAVFLGWLPAGGRGETTSSSGCGVSFLNLDGLSHMILPAINLALFKMALVIRLARGPGTREVDDAGLHQVRARQGPVAPPRGAGCTFLKNIMIPVVTILGLELGFDDRLRGGHRIRSLPWPAWASC